MQVKDKVKAALALLPLSQHHQIELTPKDALRYTKKTWGYNQYSPESAAKLIKEINAIVPKMNFGPNNPNNGRTHHNFKVGREYSMCLYVTVIKAYLPAAFNYLELAEKLKQLALTAHCDEHDITENTEEPFNGAITGEFTYRFWWD